MLREQHATYSRTSMYISRAGRRIGDNNLSLVDLYSLLPTCPIPITSTHHIVYTIARTYTGVLDFITLRVIGLPSLTERAHVAFEAFAATYADSVMSRSP